MRKQITIIWIRISTIIGEGIYENSMDIGRLSVGIKHLQAYTDNQYMGDYRTKAKMDESETAVYADFQKKIKKVTYTVGIRGTRSYVNQRGVDALSNLFFFAGCATELYPVEQVPGSSGLRRILGFGKNQNTFVDI